jgi:hypothetical protein
MVVRPAPVDEGILPGLIHIQDENALSLLQEKIGVYPALPGRLKIKENFPFPAENKGIDHLFLNQVAERTQVLDLVIGHGPLIHQHTGKGQLVGDATVDFPVEPRTVKNPHHHQQDDLDGQDGEEDFDGDIHSGALDQPHNQSTV